MIIAQATMARYMERRSHERKVRSFAQWSRASEETLSKIRGPQTGFVRKRWLDSAMCLCWNVSYLGVLVFQLLGVEMGSIEHKNSDNRNDNEDWSNERGIIQKKGKRDGIGVRIRSLTL